MRYDALAARRYKKYKWQQRRQSIRKKMLSWIFQIFRAVIIAMQKAGIIRTSNIETVTVE